MNEMSVMTAFSEGRTRLRKKQREGGREREEAKGGPGGSVWKG